MSNMKVNVATWWKVRENERERVEMWRERDMNKKRGSVTQGEMCTRKKPKKDIHVIQPHGPNHVANPESNSVPTASIISLYTSNGMSGSGNCRKNHFNSDANT